MRHKHYDCIVAWAEGKKIQFKTDDEWKDIMGVFPAWYEDSEYRIKPELTVKCYYVTERQFSIPNDFSLHNLKLTWDGDKLVGAEVL